MIISGLRISCAMTVDSRPSDDRRSFCDISRWNRAIESVSVLKVVGQQPRVLVVPAPPEPRAIFRVRSPVAATSRIDVGDGGQRPRDGARDGEAEERRQQDRDDAPSPASAGVDRLEEPQLLGARPQDQRHRARPVAARPSASSSGRGSADVLVAAERDARDAGRRAADAASAG